ncbi:hypothetical protein ABVT39_014703, partial [Epinephelus coioides]
VKGATVDRRVEIPEDLQVMPPRRNKGQGDPYAWRPGGIGAGPRVTAVGRCQGGYHQRAPRRGAPPPQWLVMSLMSQHLTAAGMIMRAQGQQEQRKLRKLQKKKKKKKKKAAAQKQVQQRAKTVQTQTQETQTQGVQTQEMQAQNREHQTSRPYSQRNSDVGGQTSIGGGIQAGIIAAVLLTLLLIMTGVKPSEGAEQSDQDQGQMDHCLLVLGSMAVKQGQMPSGEIVQLTYYKSHAYDDVLVEGPGNIRLRGWSIEPQCRAERMVTARVWCDNESCANIDTRHIVPVELAQQWLKLKSEPCRRTRNTPARDTELIRTTTWRSNMFYQWLEYSAKQVTNSSCIVYSILCGWRQGKPVTPIIVKSAQ